MKRHIDPAVMDGNIDVLRQLAPGPYCEMFARARRPGWHTLGNEAPKEAT